MTLSIGVAGALGPDMVAELAPAIESAGLETLWINDTPDGDALAALTAAASVTRTLRLGTGVLPIDRRSAEDVVAEVRTLALPLDRLTLGIGSGALRRGARDAVGRAVQTLRALEGARVVVGALGPRMRRLAAEEADGALLSWLSPDIAAAQARTLHEISSESTAVLYVRTALDPAASARLAAEAARYGSYPNYAANFARLDLDAMDTVIDGAAAAGERLPAYRAAVDEVVLRAIIPDDDASSYLAFVHAVGAMIR